MSTAAAQKRLSTLDYILAAVDTPQRPADFGIVFHLKTLPSLKALRAGARSARNRYPVSGSAIEGKRWVPVHVPSDGIASAAFSLDAAECFLNQRMDLRNESIADFLSPSSD